MLSRGINGAGPLFPTIAAGAGMLFFNWLLGWVEVRSRLAERIVRDQPVELVRQGTRREDAVRKAQLTESDLASALRLHGVPEDLNQVRSLYLERNGQFSVMSVDRTGSARIVEVRVREGVQTIRIEL